MKFHITQSSPRDCGAINSRTGNIDIQRTKLYCPRGYEPFGIERGGPIGSYKDKIYYRAEGFCRNIYFEALPEYAPRIQ